MTTKNKKTVLVVTGTRAEYGLLRSIMDAIAAHKHLSLRLLVTGMHTLRSFGYTKRQIERDGYKVDATVAIAEGDDQLSALAKEIAGIRAYCLRERPDLLLAQGDRDEVFAAAIVAAHPNIPNAHIHGGEKTGPGVDERIRHAITKMAHLHFPSTAKSAQRIVAMGEERWRIHSLGSSCLDFLVTERFISRSALAKKMGLDAARPWLAVLQHPTPFDSAPLQKQIGSVLRAVSRFPEYEKIVLYPNSDDGSALFVRRIKKLKGPRNHVFASLPREQYTSVLKESEVLVGNSSSGIIEVSPIGTPSVDVGNRQRGRERAQSVISATYDAKKIAAAMRRAIALKKKHKGRPFRSPYGRGGVGKKIARVLSRELSNPKLLHKVLL